MLCREYDIYSSRVVLGKQVTTMPKKRYSSQRGRAMRRRRTGRSKGRSVYKHYKSHGYSGKVSTGMKNRTMAIQRSVFTNNYKLIAFTVDYTFHFRYASGSTQGSTFAWILAFNGNGMLRPFENAQSIYSHWNMVEQKTGTAGDPGRAVDGFSRWIGGTSVIATAPYQKYVVKGAKLSANLTPMARNSDYPGTAVQDSQFHHHNALMCVPTTVLDQTKFNASIFDWQQKRGVIQNNINMPSAPSNVQITSPQQAKIVSGISPKKMLGAADLRDDPENHGTAIMDAPNSCGWMLALQSRTPRDSGRGFFSDHILRVKIDYTALCFDPTLFNSGEIID